MRSYDLCIFYRIMIQGAGPDNTFLPSSNAAHSTVGKPVPNSWGQVIPGEESTSREHVYEASQQLVAAGLSVIPIDAYEGTKAPDSFRLPHPSDLNGVKQKSSWSIFQIRRPNIDELNEWHAKRGPYGLAVIGGAVSGGCCGVGLEVIDFDTADLFAPWTKAVEKIAPGLVNRLVRIRTPRPGMHVYYRCSHFGICQKLAFAVSKDGYGNVAVDRSGNSQRKTLIEMKAEGGYCLIPPSPARCHPMSQLYRYAEGSPTLEAVPTITPEERAILLNTARSLSQWQEVKPTSTSGKKSSKRNDDLSLPGNDFNARANWPDILTPHGWKLVDTYGEESRWCRPGKSDGPGATTNYKGNDLLHVFTSNGYPLEQDEDYAKFTAYTLLNHEGDFKKARVNYARKATERKV